MSVSTTCKFFWTDVHFSVVSSQFGLQAKCDSSLVHCMANAGGGTTASLTCDSALHSGPRTDVYHDEYFCVCGNNQLKIPSGVDCGTSCYSLTTTFPKCNWVSLVNGHNTNLVTNAVLDDTCSSFKCEADGIHCDGDGTLWICDNKDHQIPIAADSRNNYVCNCKDPAAIPEVYRAKGGSSTGTKCASGGSQTSAASNKPSSVASSTKPTTGPGQSSTKSEGKPTSGPAIVSSDSTVGATTAIPTTVDASTQATTQAATTSSKAGAAISIFKSAPLSGVLVMSVLAGLFLHV